jgi:hypothetical protein
LDEDGYATDNALHLIEEWHFSDGKAFFAFLNGWQVSSWGWNECDGGVDYWTQEQP